MKRGSLKGCLLADCVSFTVAALISSILVVVTPDRMFHMTPNYYLELFVVTTFVNVLMLLTMRLPIDCMPVNMLIDLLDVAVGVLGLGGGIFHWFGWRLGYVVEAVTLLTVVYFVTYGLMIWQNRELARQINRHILQCKCGKKHAAEKQQQ
jgi:hypothetical protein